MPTLFKEDIMAVRSKDEILTMLKDYLKEDTSDTALALLEDISDSLNNNGEDWKKKYEENEKEWRERYKARFFEKVEDVKEDAEDVKEDVEDKEDSEEKILSYDKLFKEGK